MVDLNSTFANVACNMEGERIASVRGRIGIKGKNVKQYFHKAPMEMMSE